MVCPAFFVFLEAKLTTPTPLYILMIMVSIGFLLGMATFISGLLTLALRAPGRDIRALASQTTKLAQKGIAEEISGLVGNATSLLDVINQLARTTAGIGLILTLLGLVLMALSGWFALLIYQTLL